MEKIDYKIEGLDCAEEVPALRKAQIQTNNPHPITLSKVNELAMQAARPGIIMVRFENCTGFPVDKLQEKQNEQTRVDNEMADYSDNRSINPLHRILLCS